MDSNEGFKIYTESVLSKVKSEKNKQIRATMLWYKENDAITESDIIEFKKMTDLRNKLGHDLMNSLFDVSHDSILETYYRMIELYKKIMIWWIREIDIPTNPDYTSEQYDAIKWDEVEPVIIEFINIMTDIAFTGNEEYLEILKRRKR